MKSIDMSVRRYTSEDYTTLCTWFHERNMIPVQESFLPKVGFVVPGLAMGFLVQTDAGFCIIEPFISNKSSSNEDRDMALNVIVEVLTATAKQMGYKGIFGFSTSLPMIRRVLKQGYIVNEVNSSTVFKELQ